MQIYANCMHEVKVQQHELKNLHLNTTFIKCEDESSCGSGIKSTSHEHTPGLSLTKTKLGINQSWKPFFFRERAYSNPSDIPTRLFSFNKNSPPSPGSFNLILQLLFIEEDRFSFSLLRISFSVLAALAGIQKDFQFYKILLTAHSNPLEDTPDFFV